MTGSHRRKNDRCDQGGSTQARPEEKMSRRKTKDWPYANLRSIQAYFPEAKVEVTTPMRKVLKKAMNKKRRQRDRDLST